MDDFDYQMKVTYVMIFTKLKFDSKKKILTIGEVFLFGMYIHTYVCIVYRACTFIYNFRLRELRLQNIGM